MRDGFQSSSSVREPLLAKVLSCFNQQNFLRQTLEVWVVFVCLYLAAVGLGYFLRHSPSVESGIWLASGVYASALFVCRPVQWPIIFVGAVCVELIADIIFGGQFADQHDLELAFLGLSQKLNDAAQAQARYRQAEARLEELLPDWSARRVQIPKALWSMGATKDIDQWVELHPAVTAARADWEVMRKAAELARLKGKAEPTIGLNGGKSSGDTVIGVTLSIPLNIRNNFSAEARAANRQALAAEAGYHSVLRKQRAAIRATKATMSEYETRFLRWQTLMQGRGESSGNLLEKQWRNRDMSTTEYLLSLQQRTDGLTAGIELHTQFQMARIEWLLQTGQMKNALMQVNR